MKRPSLLSHLVALTALLAPLPSAVAQLPVPVPPPATARLATPELRIVPDRADWTYQPGERVRFHVHIHVDRAPVGGVSIRYEVGPEMMPARAVEALVPAEGLAIDGGTLAEPGFIRCAVTAEIEGRPYRAVATAGFAPERIAPTQTEPDDFDAFWQAGQDQLAQLPVDARLTLLPESGTAKIDVYHVSLQTAGAGTATPRVYGILCVPKAPGRYPAILSVPGAGVRPYQGLKSLAEAGAITLQIGIHGIPVNLPLELYEELRRSALSNYPLFNLDDRYAYYYRRVYLACLRANDFLTNHPAWDGKNLIVRGGSQGGQLAIVTAALDPRVTALAANFPAYADVTGYLHGRAGGWPHMMRGDSSRHRTPEKIATTAYYDTVNFARRLKVPGLYSWGYNDEVCPPTSLYAAYNVITAPKELLLALQTGHSTTPEQNEAIDAWVLAQAGLTAPGR